MIKKSARWPGAALLGEWGTRQYQDNRKGAVFVEVIELNRLEAAVYKRIRRGMTIPAALRSLGIRNNNIEQRVRTSLVSSGLVKIRGKGRYAFSRKKIAVNEGKSIYDLAARGRKGSKTIDLDELLETRGPREPETLVLYGPDHFPDHIIDYIQGHAKAGAKRSRVLDRVNEELKAMGRDPITKVQLNHLWGRWSGV